MSNNINNSENESLENVEVTLLMLNSSKNQIVDAFVEAKIKIARHKNKH